MPVTKRAILLSALVLSDSMPVVGEQRNLLKKMKEKMTIAREEGKKTKKNRNKQGGREASGHQNNRNKQGGKEVSGQDSPGFLRTLKKTFWGLNEKEKQEEAEEEAAKQQEHEKEEAAKKQEHEEKK